MAVNPAKAKEFIRFWLPVLLWMLVIFYFSSVPGDDLPQFFAFQDILFHLVAYIILVYFFTRALRKTNPLFIPRKVIYLAVVFGVTYGASDEFHQFFVSGRNASLADLLIDSLGSLIGSLIYR